MLEQPKLKRYTCVSCSRVDLLRGGSISYTCLPCMKSDPSQHLRLRRVLSGQGEAARAVAEAVRYGHIAKASARSCADCGDRATSYDHRDYNKPLSVDPVCRSCNNKRGYAIPLHGYIAEFMAVGGIPFGRSSWLGDLFSRMGISAAELAHMPAYLTFEHWQSLAHYFTPEAAHA